MANPLKEEQNKLITWSLVILASFAIAAGLYFTRHVMVPFVLSVFVACLVSPAIDYQVNNLRAPKVVAVIVAVLLVVGVAAVFAVMMIIAVQTVIETVDHYSDTFSSICDQAVTVMRGWGLDIGKQQIAEEIKHNLPAAAKGIFGTVSGMVTMFGLVLVFTTFLLAGRSSLPTTSGVYRTIDRQVRKYLLIKVAVSLVTAAAVGILLYLLGLRTTALLFAVLTFLLNFIPSLGSIIATLLPLPMAVAHFGATPWVLLVVALPGSVQLLMGNVVEPKLQGAGLKLHPVVILLSLALWGLLWGVAGMVLAVPITAVLRIVLLQFETTRPFGDLLAGILPQVDLEEEGDESEQASGSKSK